MPKEFVTRPVELMVLWKPCPPMLMLVLFLPKFSRMPGAILMLLRNLHPMMSALLVDEYSGTVILRAFILCRRDQALDER